MIIYLGENLKGEIYPSIVREGEVALGVTSVGLNGFVELLELECGLRRRHQSSTFQKEHYLQSLEKNIEGSFYKESFLIDPQGVSEHLYSRRCELIKSGYKFDGSSMPLRLSDMCKVESDFTCKDSLEDRLASVLEFLTINPDYKINIDEIRLLVTEESFPYVVGEILNLLKNKDISITGLPKIEKPSKAKSLSVKNEFEAISICSHLIKKNPSYVAYCSSDLNLLDIYNQQDSLPSLGEGSVSHSRPSIQLIVLISQFLWEPLDPNKVIGFLNLSVKPLNSSLAWRLANALEDSPGIGGEPWQKAIDRYVKKEEDGEKKEKALNNLKFIFERTRYPKDAAPVEDIIELFSFVREYLSKRMAFDSDRSAFKVGYSVANDLCELLGLIKLRKSSLSKLELENILEDFIPQVEEVYRTEQVGRPNVISTCENIFSNIDTLVWYPFTDMSSGPESMFWTIEELDFLKRAGANIQMPFEKVKIRLDRQSRLASLSDNLILIIPESINGSDVSEHPLSHEIQIEEISLESISSELYEYSELKKLPSIRGEWNLNNTSTLVPREWESYSSLEKLFHYPWLYVLDYKAAFSSESISSITNDFRVKGIFAHKIFEDYFTEYNTPDLMKGSDLMGWYESNFNRYVEQYAILWKHEGQETTLISMKEQVGVALEALSNHLVEDNWTVLGMEHKLKDKIYGTGFTGYIDMALERGSEKCAVDLKYGGSKKYNGYLQENRDLQLSLYSKFYGEGSFAYTAYFIIAEALMFTKDPRAFTNARDTVQGDMNALYGELWGKMDNTFSARMGELKDGEILVRDLKTEGLTTEDTVKGDDYLDMSKDKGNIYHKYDVLLGYVEEESDE
jgi:hypothetical protein